MAKSRTIESPSSDDDVPEVISKSTSKASARRHQKALQNFEAEEKARRKTRNREREMKLKERAVATGKNNHSRPTEFAKGESSNRNISREEDEDLEMDMSRATDGGNDNRMKARMDRAIQEALKEDGGDDEEGKFGGFGGELDDADMLVDSGSEDAEDATISHEGNSDSGAEDPEGISEGSMSEGERTLPPSNIHRSGRRPQYLSDDLFTAAFASQKSKLSTQKASLNHREPARKRRRKPSGRPKDVVVGGRTIRTLTRLSDPKSKATARTLPPARGAFVNRSLTVEGKGAFTKTKQRGWERRPVNIGVMKSEGAPIGFCRASR